MYPPDAHEGLTLLAFLTALNTQMQQLTRDELAARVNKYAETVPAAERMAFLRQFTASAQPEVMMEVAPPASEPDESLIEDVDAFAEEIRKQTYVEDWDYDYSDNMLVTGDESWSDNMEDLFSRTDAAFFAGDFAVAADAYEKLLTLFALQDETGEGYFPGEEDPVSMVGINIDETVARLLRCLLASEDSQWTTTFIDKLAKFSQQFDLRLPLKAILEASPQPLVNTEQVLLAIEPLFAERAQGMSGYSWPDWAKLLREATLIRAGSDGLGKLAREVGAGQPEAYYEWILALRNEKRHEEALHATQNAVADVRQPRAQGVLANTLGVMFHERAAEADAWRAKELAWTSYPSLYNLTVLLSHNHADIPVMLARLDEEYARYQRGELSFSVLEYNADSMRILFLALAGDLNRIDTEAHITSGVGWSAAGHIGYTASTVLLLALLVPPALPPAGSILATYTEEIVQRATTSGLNSLLPTPNVEHAVNYPELLIARLTQLPVSEGRRASYRDTVKQLALRRVEGIVGNQHRSAYDRAAQIVVAYAEASLLADQATDITAFPHAVLAKYPRHSAFHAAMRGQWRSSSVVRKIKL